MSGAAHSGPSTAGSLAAGTRRIRVLVVEDSPVIQQLLSHVIGADPRLEVAGIASSGEQALRMIEKNAPDVVSLDIRLPGIDGFEVTSRIMRQNPLPIVVVASDVRDLDIPMRALQAGALAVVEKPGSMARADYQTVAHHLCTQLVIMSQVKVIRHRITARAVRSPGANGDTPSTDGGLPEAVVTADGRIRRFRGLGLVASTGGPAALAKVLKELPAGFPLPVFVVQHMGAPFMEGFAWLVEHPVLAGGIITVWAIAMFPVNFFITTGLAHLGCIITGMRNHPISVTVRALGYASASNIALVIPVVGGFGGIYTLVLQIWGLRELQQGTTGKAIFAILWWLLIFFCCAFTAAIAGVAMVASKAGRY